MQEKNAAVPLMLSVVKNRSRDWCAKRNSGARGYCERWTGHESASAGGGDRGSEALKIPRDPEEWRAADPVFNGDVDKR